MNEKTEQIYNELLLEKAKAKAKARKSEKEYGKNEKCSKESKKQKDKFPFWLKKKGKKTKDESADFSYDPMEELEMIAESVCLLEYDDEHDAEDAESSNMMDEKSNRRNLPVENEDDDDEDDAKYFNDEDDENDDNEHDADSKDLNQVSQEKNNAPLSPQAKELLWIIDDEKNRVHYGWDAADSTFERDVIQTLAGNPNILRELPDEDAAWAVDAVASWSQTVNSITKQMGIRIRQPGHEVKILFR